MEKTIEETSVFKEKLTKIFINCEDTMPVGDLDQFKRHAGGAFHGILVTARWTESTVTTEGNKLQVATFGAAIHGATESGVTTMNHPLDIFNDSVARMKGINHFFIVISKNFLQGIHTIIMREMKVKENPYSPHE
jgi:hypothetical protein